MNLTVELERLVRDCAGKCMICGSAFNDHDTEHVGYDENLTPLVVGDCHAGLLSETVIRYSYSKPIYSIPPRSTVVWRYMDFSKFMALINSKSLFFTRTDRFEDPFEGAKGPLSRKQIWDDYYLEVMRTAIRNPPPGYVVTLSDDEVEKRAVELFQQLETAGNRDRTTTFVSCWYESEYESDAMWKLFSREAGYMVAISSTVDQLIMSLGDNPHIKIGRVNYIDYNKSYAPINGAVFMKRKCFEHEKEIRAVIRIMKDPPEYGYQAPVDLHQLISSIHVSPVSDNWFADLVRDATKMYGVNAPVIQSTLRDKPFF